jgi:hypothetical protein
VRREITVDGPTSTIKVKFWGDQVRLVKDLKIGETVTVKCVMTDLYMSTVSLNSTMQTVISSVSVLQSVCNHLQSNSVCV